MRNVTVLHTTRSTDPTHATGVFLAAPLTGELARRLRFFAPRKGEPTEALPVEAPSRMFTARPRKASLGELARDIFADLRIKAAHEEGLRLWL